jgi:hypothetical protein
MKLRSLRVIKWYAATLGVAAGAVLYAYAGFGPVLPGILIFSLVCYHSVRLAARHDEEENNPYHKISEYIAVAGIIAFLPLLMLVDFVIALVIFLGFAQLALNFQTHDYRRFYLGMVVSFIGLCVGAAQSKSGFYLFFFLVYTVLAGMAIGYAYMSQRGHLERPEWDWKDRTRVSLLMIGLATAIYLILPRFPAGGLLAQPGSDHFYRNKNWEAEAEKNDKTSPSDRINALREKQRSHQNGLDPEDLIENQPGERSKANAESRPGGYDYRGFHEEFNINTPDENGHRFSNRIVARMRSDHPQYLRVRIFDIFDGLRWHASSDQIVKHSVGYDGVELRHIYRAGFGRLRSRGRSARQVEISGYSDRHRHIRADTFSRRFKKRNRLCGHITTQPSEGPAVCRTSRSAVALLHPIATPDGSPHCGTGRRNHRGGAIAIGRRNRPRAALAHALSIRLQLCLHLSTLYAPQQIPI